MEQPIIQPSTPAVPVSLTQDEDEKKASNAMSLDMPNDDDSEMLKLVSKDRKEFDVRKKYAIISNLIKTTVEGDKEEKEIPVDVPSELLQQVVDYMNHVAGKDIPKVAKLTSNDIKDAFPDDKWLGTFAENNSQPDQILTRTKPMITTANYLDIPGLLSLMQSAVGARLRGLKITEIRKLRPADKKDEKTAKMEEGSDDILEPRVQPSVKKEQNAAKKRNEKKEPDGDAAMPVVKQEDDSAKEPAAKKRKR